MSLHFCFYHLQDYKPYTPASGGLHQTGIRYGSLKGELSDFIMDTVPLGKNVNYRMDTVSLDKNVSIRRVRREKYPESKLRMWSHLSRVSAVKNCTVYRGTAVGVIMMQQDSTACERIKQRGTKLHKNHNFLGFWQHRPLTQISTLSNYMTPYYLHFNYQLLKCVTDSKWRGL